MNTLIIFNLHGDIRRIELSVFTLNAYIFSLGVTEGMRYLLLTCLDICGFGPLFMAFPGT